MSESASPAPSVDAAEPGPSAPAAPSSRMKWAHRIAVVAAIAIAASYCISIGVIRFEHAFDPWWAETDTKQVTYQYYRYTVPGALPLGHLLQDYAAIYNGPPIFHAIMAPLSAVMDAKDAASAVNVVLFFGALIAVGVAVSRRSNAFVGAAAAMLLCRSSHFFRIPAGGYARTFGPTLVLVFLAAWLYASEKPESARRRLGVLAVLVLQAGIYPSVMMACALAYGVWEVVRFLRKREWRRMVELSVAGVVCLLFALSQNLRSPEEWGGPIRYEDALKHPAFFAGSRMPLVPHQPIKNATWSAAASLFNTNGTVAFPELSQWNGRNRLALIWAPFALCAVALVVWRKRYKFPFEVVATFAGALAAYLLARKMAFELHVPHRPIAHAWPYILAVGLPVLAFGGAMAVLNKRKIAATIVAIAITLGPAFLLAGDGDFAPKTYRNYGRDAKLYEWIRKKTPLDAQFAGNFQILDEIPLFSWRPVYVNWKLAHPFRAGYWKLIEERTVDMYRAYYATDWQTVLDFCDRADIDYFVVDQTRFAKLERGDGQLFEPLRGKVQPLFNAAQKAPPVLKTPPKGSVVFHHRVYDVIDIKKLKAALAAAPASDATPGGANDAASDAANDGANDDSSDGASDGADDGASDGADDGAPAPTK